MKCRALVNNKHAHKFKFKISLRETKKRNQRHKENCSKPANTLLLTLLTCVRCLFFERWVFSGSKLVVIWIHMAFIYFMCRLFIIHFEQLFWTKFYWLCETKLRATVLNWHCFTKNEEHGNISFLFFGNLVDFWVHRMVWWLWNYFGNKIPVNYSRKNDWKLHKQSILETERQIPFAAKRTYLQD